MTKCQLCEKDIQPFKSDDNPTIAKVGMVCGRCGIVMCWECVSSTHNCREQLIRFGWIDADSKPKNPFADPVSA